MPSLVSLTGTFFCRLSAVFLAPGLLSFFPVSARGAITRPWPLTLCGLFCEIPPISGQPYALHVELTSFRPFYLTLGLSFLTFRAPPLIQQHSSRLSDFPFAYNSNLRSFVFGLAARVFHPPDTWPRNETRLFLLLLQFRPPPVVPHLFKLGSQATPILRSVC